MTNAMTSNAVEATMGQAGPSFVMALCGFLGTMVATTTVVLLISSVA